MDFEGHVISFFAPGIPAQQGSKDVFGAGRFREANPQLKSWRSVVAGACPATAPLTGPVQLRVTFWYPRPKNHYGRRKGEPYLKPDAPLYKSSAPDCDKLVRAVFDALTGIAYVDDAQIAVIISSKCYTTSTAGANITISQLSQPTVT